MKDAPMVISMTAKDKTYDSIEISGNITVKIKIDGNLQLDIVAAQCTLDMKDCMKFGGPPPFTNLCSSFTTKGSFYSQVFENISPEWKCPIQPGNYTMTKATIDLSIVSLFPLDGSVWVTTFRFIDEKSKKVYMCLNTETRVLRKRFRN